MSRSRIPAVILPLLILLLGVGIFVAMKYTKPEPEERKPVQRLRVVRVVEARKEERKLSIRVHGTVLPRTETTLIPQVSGEVVWTAPNFEQGGFFEPDAVLVRIDPTDYELALAQAELSVAQANMNLAREEAEARLARKEWEAFGKGKPDPLTVREPQLAQARAAVSSARAAISQAKLRLDRTEVRAPFAGRIRSKHADVGQYVMMGAPLARVYAVDYAEIRLPVPLDEFAHLDLDLGDQNGGEKKAPHVTLRAEFGGAMREWKARIVRTEAEIDARTRMLHVVARVEDPYGRKASSAKPPLMVGLFVEAEIEGRTARGVVVVPRGAVRSESRVLLVDAEDRLHFRDVEVLRFEGETAILRSGVEEGERICVSYLETAVDGMRVKVHEGEAE